MCLCKDECINKLKLYILTFSITLDMRYAWAAMYAESFLLFHGIICHFLVNGTGSSEFGEEMTECGKWGRGCKNIILQMTFALKNSQSYEILILAFFDNTRDTL